MNRGGGSWKAEEYFRGRIKASEKMEKENGASEARWWLQRRKFVAVEKRVVMKDRDSREILLAHSSLIYLFLF